MVYRRYTGGIQEVYVWHTGGIRMVYRRYTYGIREVYVWHSFCLIVVNISSDIGVEEHIDIDIYISRETWLAIENI